MTIYSSATLIFAFTGDLTSYPTNMFTAQELTGQRPSRTIVSVGSRRHALSMAKKRP